MSDQAPLKRRRKTSSCASCRKLKTRCDFESATGKCHRCNVLKIACSLTDEKAASREGDQLFDQEDDRLDRIEGQIMEILSKLGHDKPVKSSDYKYVEHLGKGKSNHLDNSSWNAPLNVISRIDSKLFGRVDGYKAFAQLCEQEFIKGFYNDRQQLCIRLGTNFLTIAHFWIVPGGIKEISDGYIREHPFIASVFVLLAMGFDENYSYKEEQSTLYWIVRKMLAMALTTSPITDHDVEAILYCALYNIARKPLQPLLDSWTISSDAMKQMMIGTSFQSIEDKVNARDFKETDLFHLRIWTLLCVCHLQHSIGSGKPQLIPHDYIDVCDLVTEYPWANLEDNVNYALVKLTKQVHRMFYTKDLILNLIKYEQVEDVENVKCFRFEELHHWQNHWRELIDNDVSGTLLFNLDFYHIILSRRFIASYKNVSDFKVVKYMDIAYNTAIFHSRAILDRFLQLPKSQVKGSPSFLLTQVVYSCLTLYDFQSKFENKFNIKSLNLLSRVYWHLNHVGETKNDATDTVGQIIKTLVDVRTEPVPENEPPVMNEFENDYKPLHDEISYEYTSDISASRNNNELLNVEKFDTFEDFFKGILGQENM